MAVVTAGTTTCSVIVDFNTVLNNDIQDLAAVPAANVLVPSDTLDLVFNFLERAYDITGRGRAPRAQDRPSWAQAQFSVEEIYDALDNAAREVAMRVRSDFVKTLWQTINPSTNVFDQSDKLRLLGSRAKVGTVIAQKLGIYQYGDLVSRGIVWTDSQPVYTNVGGELLVYGDTPTTPNPSDAEATYIKLPEITTFTNTGAVTIAGDNITGTILLTGGGDTFDTTRDLHVLIKLDDAVDTAWSLISTVSNSTNISITGIQSLAAIAPTPTTITLTWYVPAFYEMPRILEKLIVELAIGDLMTSRGEFQKAAESYRQYQDALQEFALPQYALPLEAEQST
jgi:hypothetical protein